MTHFSLIIAHRGASAEAPENTLTAFQRAIDFNADFVELDVRLSKDGIPVVFHDSTLSRITGIKNAPAIDRLPLSKIKLVNAGQRMQHKEVIPTLEEVLNLVWKSTGLMIEIKKTPRPIDEVVSSVFEVLSKAKALPKNLMIGSFVPEIIDSAQVYRNKIDKEIQIIGIIEKLDMIPPFVGRGVEKVALWHKLITPELMAYLTSEGIDVWTFTVDDPKKAHDLHLMGVTGIITNNPAKIKEEWQISR